MNAQEQPIANPSEALVALMTRHQSDLFRYIYSMVLNRHSAEDILQETHLSIYRSADSFKADAPYLPWARTIAYRRVMDFRRQNKQGIVALSDEVLAVIAGSHDHPGATRCESDEAEALEQCTKKLPSRHQDLLKARYADQIPVKQIAADQNRSPGSVSQLLYEIRNTLQQCIEQSLSQDRATS